MHLSTSTLWVLSATSPCYQLLSRHLVQFCFCTWHKEHLLISSSMEHFFFLLPVQARLAEHSSWCCQALKLKASLARDCSGKCCKTDGLVKREDSWPIVHDERALLSDSTPWAFMQRAKQRKGCLSSCARMCVCVWLSTLHLSTQMLHYAFALLFSFFL